MDYQASTSGGKISLVAAVKRLTSLGILFAVLLMVPRETLTAQIAENPLTSNITITATVLLGTGVNPDTPPLPPPGPINMTNTTDVAVFRGLAYPGSTIFLLRNGVIIAETKANPDGTFDIRVRNLSAGTYSFGLRAEDVNRLTSKLLLFTVVVAPGIATTVDGIFLPPTITTDKTEVKKGDTITFSGNSAPNADIRISLVPTFSTFELLKQSKTNASGTWSFILDSSELAFGSYEAKARSILPNNLSPYSDPLSFKVGNSNMLRGKGVSLSGFRKKCDLNNDDRVNLLDFSIMAFWYKRLGFPEKVDLNTDKSVNLTDLSILAYCWTG